ncbi:MAG: hypothetical protein ABI559_00460 [Chloroflexota bacterium]
MRWLIGVYAAVVLLLGGFAVVGAAIIADSTPSNPAEAAADEHSFSLVAYEFRHFPEKWLYRIGRVFHKYDEGTDDQVLQRYFNLTKREARLQDQDPASPALAAMEEERAFLENTIERIIEGRVTSLIEDQGLTADPPLFSDLGMVWPPVNFEFDQPPRVLVTSPRDKIELQGDYLLSPGISLDTVEQIESKAETTPNTSAVVVQSGGVATYPSVIDNLDDYHHVIETVAHEWTHQYLTFYPLGAKYFSSSELRTLNETVATLSGRQLEALYLQKYGDLDLSASDEPPPTATPAPTTAPLGSPVPTAAPFDFTTSMRALQTQVTAMLAQGQVAEAEALMNEKRDEFAQKGYYIRKLNQAYFAFNGFYATGPGSIDPIGPKLEQLAMQLGSEGAFLKRARAITSVSELDAALASISG